MSVEVLENDERHGPSLTAADVVLLQSVRHAPTVSVLMPTRPGDPLDDVAATRLARLVDDAGRRLRAQAPLDVADRIVDDLRHMAAEAAGTVTDRAVALFASRLISRWYLLPVPVVERVVIDRTFATRDLVCALHRTPLHAVLVLTPYEAQLHECTGSVVSSVTHRGFPMRRAAFPSGEGFLLSVDAALATHLRARPSPVLVAGDRAMGEHFVAWSKATTRFAGVVEHDPAVDELATMAQRARPVLDAYLRSREHEALVRLARTPRHLVAAGLDAVWRASRLERPEMLVVEEDFVHPARLGEDGDHLLPVTDPTAPDVLDDAVDEVIEVVLRRGGWVAMTAPRALAGHGRIALTLRVR